MISTNTILRKFIQENFESYFQLTSSQIQTKPVTHLLSQANNPILNMITPHQVEPHENLPEILELLTNHYRKFNKQCFSWFTNDATRSMESPLEKQGLHYQMSFAGMICKPSPLDAIDNLFKLLDKNFELKEVHDEFMIEDMLIPFKIAFEFSQEDAKRLGHQFKKLLHVKTSLKHFVLYHKASPIACSSLLGKSVLKRSMNIKCIRKLLRFDFHYT